MFGISKFYKFSAEKKKGRWEHTIKIKELRHRWRGEKDKAEQFAKLLFLNMHGSGDTDRAAFIYPLGCRMSLWTQPAKERS